MEKNQKTNRQENKHKNKNEKVLTNKIIAGYAVHLHAMERSSATIEKYLKDVNAFSAWANGKPITCEMVIAWKAHLKSSGLNPATVNTKLAALNGLFAFLGWYDCRVHYLKVQKKLFRPSEKDLNGEEYERLVQAAKDAGDIRLMLLFETICSTGIRVSEVKYITVEACNAGQAEISLKGKIRVILLPNKLKRKLLKYAKKQKIASGEIFLTRSGKSMNRRQIWAQMKRICKRAEVDPQKVFPHNLRHLFATSYYRKYKDIVKLADVLGHASVDTTRIYLLTTGDEHRRQLEQLRLVS